MPLDNENARPNRSFCAPSSSESTSGSMSWLRRFGHCGGRHNACRRNNRPQSDRANILMMALVRTGSTTAGRSQPILEKPHGNARCIVVRMLLLRLAESVRRCQHHHREMTAGSDAPRPARPAAEAEKSSCPASTTLTAGGIIERGMIIYPSRSLSACIGKCTVILRRGIV